MTTAAMHSNASGHRHRAIRQRAPEAVSTVTDSEPSPTAINEYSKASTHIPAIAGVISAIGVVVILVFAVWKYRAMKNKTRGVSSLAGRVTVEQERHYDIKHIDLEDVSVYMEKPEKAVLTPTSFDNQVGWVPQVKPHPYDYGTTAKVAIPQPMAANKKSRALQLSVDATTRDLASPPPSYFASNSSPETQSPRTIPIPPSPPTSISHPPTPPTPPANRKIKTSFSSLSEEAPLPTPSPRSESFAAQDLVLPRQSIDTFSDDSGLQKLPRLMTVATTFTPSLDDELAIKLGDTIRMVEEYRDGWCLVQRVGRIDAPKGVVPRFCLQERRGVVPVVPTRKFSSGSLKGQSWR